MPSGPAPTCGRCRGRWTPRIATPRCGCTSRTSTITRSTRPAVGSVAIVAGMRAWTIIVSSTRPATAPSPRTCRKRVPSGSPPCSGKRRRTRLSIQICHQHMSRFFCPLIACCRCDMKRKKLKPRPVRKKLLRGKPPRTLAVHLLRPKPPAVLPRDKARPANNTTCDVYFSPNVPPAAPDVAGVVCHLSAEFSRGAEGSEGDQTFRWTHLLYVNADVDIRDTYPNAPANRVYVPDKNGTGFDIVFVEIVNRGTPAAYKRVFLDRRTPTWPTNEL